MSDYYNVIEKSNLKFNKQLYISFNGAITEYLST